MLQPIGLGAVEYYWRGPDPGRWSGSGARALGLDEIPNAETLTRVLAGRHPESGERLGHAHSHRRAGWDLIFAAPKSVSLLAAVAPLGDSRTMSTAHQGAVAETVRWIEEEVAWARRQGARVAAKGVVAAVFEHGNNANGEPHLHTHVLLANLVEGPDGRWSALDQSILWLERRTIGAIYDLALRHQVCRHWSRLRWHLGEHGLADVAGVPREAIEAVSVRRSQVLRDVGGAEVRDPARPEPLALANVRAVPSPRRTRFAASRTRVAPAGTDWRARLAQTGFRPAHAATLLAPSLTGSRDRPEPEPSNPAQAAEAWLTAHASSWSRSDAIRALAATAERGASPALTASMVDELCRRSPSAGPGRWSTVAARRLDESVVRAAQDRAHRTLPAVPDILLTEVLDRRPGLSSATRTAVRHLVGQRGPVSVLPGVLGRDRLVEQAAVLEAARASWEASGIGVVVDATAKDISRWTALAGLRQPGPGVRVGVIVVDRADRRTSAELLDLLSRAERTNARVVLVEGGTLPARGTPRSAALEGLKGLSGHRETDSQVPLPVIELEGPARPSPTAHRSGRIVATATMADALDTIVDRWATFQGGRRPVMVALGPPEAEALNRLARNTLVAAGEVGTNQVVIGGRCFAPGDRVLARRPGPAPSASLGTVESVTSTPPAVSVRWNDQADRAGRVDAWRAQHLVHGYAVTAGVATRLSEPLLLLGDPNNTPRLAHRDVTGIVIAPTGERRRDPFDRLSRLAEIARVARPIRRDRPIRTGIENTREGIPALAARRDRLEAELRAHLPPDLVRERRLLEEDLAYATTHPGSPGSPAARDLEQRAAQLARSEARLTDWLQASGERLTHWSELGRLIDEQSDVIAHAATLDPGSVAQLVAGPAPTDPVMLPGWQRAVQATAIHAARWPERVGWPGTGTDLRPGPAAGRSPAELDSRRRRDQAIDALGRDRGRRSASDVVATRASGMRRDEARLER
jgi:conjugative relaxase-like TrwC/TraI family protein